MQKPKMSIIQNDRNKVSSVQNTETLGNLFYMLPFCLEHHFFHLNFVEFAVWQT